MFGIHSSCPQVASSTWTTNMLRLDSSFNSDLPESKRWLKEYGARENEAFRKYPVPKTEEERRTALVEATKFLVVRHPLDRLVSSYLDKVRIIYILLELQGGLILDLTSKLYQE